MPDLYHPSGESLINVNAGETNGQEGIRPGHCVTEGPRAAAGQWIFKPKTPLSHAYSIRINFGTCTKFVNLGLFMDALSDDKSSGFWLDLRLNL